ncbi:hypothetical protein D3C75_947990 [compost metagenome]
MITVRVNGGILRRDTAQSLRCIDNRYFGIDFFRQFTGSGLILRISENESCLRIIDHMGQTLHRSAAVERHKRNPRFYSPCQRRNHFNRIPEQQGYRLLYTLLSFQFPYAAGDPVGLFIKLPVIQ